MFQYEESAREDVPGLSHYSVVDADRGLKLELKRSLQMEWYEFWFWRGDKCYPLMIERGAPSDEQPTIRLAIKPREKAKFREQNSKTYVEDEGETRELELLSEEAVTAFFSSRSFNRSGANVEIIWGEFPRPEEPPGASYIESHRKEWLGAGIAALIGLVALAVWVWARRSR